MAILVHLLNFTMAMLALQTKLSKGIGARTLKRTVKMSTHNPTRRMTSTCQLRRTTMAQGVLGAARRQICLVRGYRVLDPVGNACDRKTDFCDFRRQQIFEVRVLRYPTVCASQVAKHRRRLFKNKNN